MAEDWGAEDDRLKPVPTQRLRHLESSVLLDGCCRLIMIPAYEAKLSRVCVWQVRPGAVKWAEPGLDTSGWVEMDLAGLSDIV